MKIAIPALAFLLLFAATATAQQPTVFFDNISAEQGLLHPNVLSLCRDSRGFLWIGTVSGGLSRYDGHEMKVYRHHDGDSLSLCGDEVFSIVEDEQGFLWIGTDGGISRFNPANGRCQNFTRQNGRLISNYENYVFKDPQGTVWTTSDGLERYDPSMQRFIHCPGTDTLSIGGRIALDQAGKFWLGGWRGLKMLDLAQDTIRRSLPYPKSIRTELNATKVRIDHAGNIWAMTWGGGLTRFNPESQQFEKFIWKPNPAFPTTENIAFDVAETFDAAGKRSFWLAAEHGIFQFPLEAKDFPSLKKPHQFLDNKSGAGLQGGQTTLFLTDQEGNLWAGGSYGVCRYNTRQEDFQMLKKVKRGPIEQITFAQNGDALLSGWEEPLTLLNTHLERKKKQALFPSGMQPEGCISWEAAKDEESGVIYIATLDGLVAYNEKTGRTRWYPHHPGDSTGLLWKKVSNVLPLGGGILLLAFWKNRLQIFDAVRGKGIRSIGENVNIVRRIKKTSDGNIWVCAEGRLMRFDAATGQLVVAMPTSESSYWDVHLDAKGRTWLATNKGLLLFDVHTNQVIAKYGTDEGLPHQSITRICEDKLGRLWLMTNFGVCYLSPDTHQCHTLGQSDGLMLKNGGAAMSQSPDGRIWLAFTDNVRVFQPESVKPPAPSRCYITELKINERDTLPEVPLERIPEIRLRPGQNALTFTYTAIDLKSFGKTNFLYRLEGLQTEWVRAGKNRTASFVNLPAGAYVFRVRPEDAGEDASWDATLRIVVTNHFWERAWFRNLMVLLAMGLVSGAAAYYYRNRLRLQQAETKRREAIESTRLQIAQDIHDEVGAELTKISLSAQFAAILPNLSEAELREKLGTIGIASREVALHLSEIVFITTPRFDQFSAVQAYFREKGREFLEEARLSVQFDFPPAAENPAVSPDVKRQLYMLYRESLNNIAKHAQASIVHVALRLSDDAQRYVLEIRDDGIGFDPTNTRQFGNGLAAMRDRAEKIGAALSIETAPGRGTAVRVEGKV